MKYFVVFLWTCFLFSFPANAKVEKIPLPQALRTEATCPEELLAPFVGIPYRVDGMLTDSGNYALFTTPDKVFARPGLNCSGFVLAASRVLLKKNIPTAYAVADRLNDSGPESDLGQDWDFGFDLIMNISDGVVRHILTPDGPRIPQENISGKTAPAWDFHHQSFATNFLANVKHNTLYLLSFSRHADTFSPARLHYHVGLLLRGDPFGPIWFYSTTRNSAKVTKVDLATERGLTRFRHSFRNTKGSVKRLTIIEVPLTQNNFAMPPPAPTGGM